MSTEHGITTCSSRHSVQETTDRIAAAAEAAGLRLFARIDHAAGAAEVGLDLRPTQLLILGHPRGGTPLMLDRQFSGIDLPVRLLAWEDETGDVWLSYTTGSGIADRHHLSPASADAVAAIDAGLETLVALAT